LTPVQFLSGSSVAGQKRPRHSQAPLVQVVGHQPHFRRRTGETVDEQHPNGAATQVEGRWVKLRMTGHLFPPTLCLASPHVTDINATAIC